MTEGRHFGMDGSKLAIQGTGSGHNRPLKVLHFFYSLFHHFYDFFISFSVHLTAADSGCLRQFQTLM